MKKLVTAGAAIAMLAGLGVTSAKATHSEPSNYCGGSLAAVNGTSASVCLVNGVKGSGTVAVTGSGGYVVADGDSSNQTLPSNCLDGYIGLQVQSGGYSGPVSSSNGDYHYGPQAPTAPPSNPPCT